MRLVRHRLLQRLVAVLLAAGTAAPLVPAATAAPGDALAAALADAGALEAGLAAARQAPTRAQAADAFVAAFVREADAPVDARQVYRLLLGETVGDVPPATPDAAFVPAPTASAPPALGLAAVSVVPSGPQGEALAAPPPADAPRAEPPRRLSGGTRAP